MTTPTTEEQVQHILALIDEAVKGASCEYGMSGLALYPRDRARIQGALHELVITARKAAALGRGSETN